MCICYFFFDKFQIYIRFFLFYFEAYGWVFFVIYDCYLSLYRLYTMQNMTKRALTFVCFWCVSFYLYDVFFPLLLYVFPRRPLPCVAFFVLRYLRFVSLRSAVCCAFRFRLYAVFSTLVVCCASHCL